MGHSRPVRQVKHNFDGDLLFSCSDDSLICMYDTFQCARTGTFTNDSACLSFDVTTDSKYLIGASTVTGANIFDVKTGKKLAKVEVPGNFSYHVSLAYGDKQFFVMYRKDKIIYLRLFDVANCLKAAETGDTPKVVKEIKCRPDTHYTHAVWGALNKTIYLSTNTGVLNTVDVASGTFLKNEQVHKQEIFKLFLTHDYTMLFTASRDGTSKLLHPETFEVIREYHYGGKPCRMVTVSPLFDDQDIQKFHCIMAGGIDAKDAAETSGGSTGGFEIQVHSIIFNEKLGEVHGSFGPVHALDFSPDGQSFASGGEDGYVRYHRMPPEYFTKRFD
jgi:translation initiation factor 3 subunit I